MRGDAILICSLLMLLGSGVKSQRTKPPPEPVPTEKSYSGDHIILAPNTIHPGLQLTLSVNILKPATTGVSVTASVLKNGMAMTPAVTVTKSFNYGTADVMALQMPQNATQGRYELQIVGTGGLEIVSQTQPLTFKLQGFVIFVQSDKAIYKPGQTIQFRAMAVYPNLKPYLGMFDLEMKDPDGNVVKQWNGLQNAEYGVVSGEMFMSSEARLGDWVIVASANGQEFEHVVEVSEYVLPKFEVSLILPPYLSGKDTEFTGMVKAKYTYGQPVKGVAMVTFKVPYVYGKEEQSIVRSNIKVSDGSAEFKFTKRDIESAYGDLFSDESRTYTFTMEAEVTETLTSLVQEGAGSIPYHHDPITITAVTGNPSTFKPNLLYTGYLSVTHVDDSMLTAAERSRGVVVRLSQGYDSTKYNETVPKIPENGIVKFEFLPEAEANNYKVMAYYRDYLPDEPSSWCQNCATINLSPAESPSTTFIQITTGNTDLTAGDTARFDISSTQVPNMLHYQIVSRGDIVSSSTYEAPTKVTELSFEVTSTMAPSPRLIVFYVAADHEVILASINFKVAGAFENEVTITASKDKVEPGQEVFLDVSCAANSYVGILAIDQSVLMLKSGNDITQGQIVSGLDEFDTTSSSGGGGGDIRPFGRRRREVHSRSKRSSWCWFCPFPIGGSTVKEVIDNAGMLVYTDGNVYGNTQPISYGYIEDYNYGVPLAAAGIADFGQDEGAAAGGQNREFDNTADSSDAADGSSAKKTRVRSEFPETWLWSDYVTDANGNVRVTSPAPDTITSWVASAFGMSREVGLGVADPTATVQVFKSFFISLNLPYSVVQGELLALQVTVFNYLANDVTAEITLGKSDSFDNIRVVKVAGTTNEAGETITEDTVKYIYESVVDQVVSAKIGANDGVTINFPIRPKKLGMIDLNVRATSNVAQDVIIQTLLVKPPGQPMSNSESLFVDTAEISGPSLTHVFTFDLPTMEEGLVEGSVRGVITATGDIMGPTINGLDKLLKLPSGCGEQNMIHFAPDVFIYKYLSSTNQDNSVIKEKALQYMEIGHSRELEYQHKNSEDSGAFSAFGDNDPRGSTWLTAFVIKSFAQASPYIYINKVKVTEAVNWLLSQQRRDGTFTEPGRVIHTEMQGNVNSDLTMTAYVLVALQEVERSNIVEVDVMNRVSEAALKAVAFLEGRQNEIVGDVYALCLATYALTMANSRIKDDLKRALDDQAQGEGGLKYWSRNAGTTPIVDEPELRFYNSRPPSADIEMTGYGLLSFLELGTPNDFAEAAGIAKWMTQQRTATGGFTSTQDTVIGLQALSEYATQLNSVTRDITIGISSDSASDTQELTINEANSIVYQQVELTATSGTVTVVVSGTGNCLIQFNYDYNLNRENLLNDFDFTIDVTDMNRNRVDVKLCGKYTGDTSEPGMGIINMGVFSGFEPMLDELKTEVMRDVNIARHEINDQGVTLYINEIGTQTCATVPLQRTKPVAKTQPAQASMYRYYQAETQVVQSFSSDTLSQSEVCDVCGSNCNNCEDKPVGAAATVLMNSALMLFLSAFAVVMAHRLA